MTSAARETVTYSETFDDEAFSATTHLGGPNAFSFDTAKQDGWDVRASSGPNAHTFVFERSFAVQAAQVELTRLAHDSAAATPPDAFLLAPTAFVGIPIAASTPNQRSVSIPALLRPSETLAMVKGSDPTFRLASAHVNAAVVDSVVRVHIQLRDAEGFHRIDPSFADATAISPASKVSLGVGQPWPLSRVLAFWRNVGPYGIFDYEHHAPPLCSADPKYRKAWMFGVGVYAQGAGIPEQLMDSAGTLAENWLSQHPVKCP